MLPSPDQINKIPLAKCGEFELTDKECASLRRYLYGLNKLADRRYRTMRDGPILIVWRIK